jgi:hypothetical protein
MQLMRINLQHNRAAAVHGEEGHDQQAQQQQWLTHESKHMAKQVHQENADQHQRVAKDAADQVGVLDLFLQSVPESGPAAVTQTVHAQVSVALMVWWNC